MPHPTNKTIQFPISQCLYLTHMHTNLNFQNPEKPQRHSSRSPAEAMKTLFVLLIFSPLFLRICNGVSVSGLNSLETGEVDVMMRKVCAGKIGECGVEAEEFQMDSESNRRVLVMQRKYISYETLKRDLVPCSRPGASYYTCKAPGQANPYNRGCEAITRCARSISDVRS